MEPDRTDPGLERGNMTSRVAGANRAERASLDLYWLPRGARPLVFAATEDFATDRVAFA